MIQFAYGHIVLSESPGIPAKTVDTWAGDLLNENE